MRIKTTLRNVFQTGGGGGSGTTGFVTELDASLGLFPVGTFRETNQVKVIEGGFISSQYVAAGSILIAMQDSPTSDWDVLTGWKVI